MQIRHITLVLFGLLLLPISLYAKKPSGSEKSSRGTIKEVDEIQRLQSLAEELNKSRLWRQRDSVIDLALDITLTKGDSVKMNIFIQYFDFAFINPVLAKDYSEEALSLATKRRSDEWLYRAYFFKGRAYLENGAAQEAIMNIERSFQIASQLKDDEKMAECLLLWGTGLEKVNNKLGAFQNYMRGIYLSEKIQNEVLQNRGYDRLSRFYKYIGNKSKAKEFKIKQLKLLEQDEEVDSVHYMNLYKDLCDILLDFGQKHEAEKAFEKVVSFAIRQKDDVLKHAIFTVYRSYLIENNLFQELDSLYNVRFPGELALVKQNNHFLYLRIAAYIHEVSNRPDSAEACYEKMEQHLQTLQESEAYYANFYKRYGQFHLRAGNLDAATRKLETAFSFAQKARFLPFLVEITGYLDSIYGFKKDFQKAYFFAALKHRYSDSLAAQKDANEVLVGELDYEAKRQELLHVRETEQTRRRHNLQYMGMILGITSSFIILVLLGSFKVHRWVIKGMGFFAFIFFFEFIVLLADHKIHHATHGEPWKIMAIKVVLIGILLPLHHWLEDKVVHYLSHHQLVDTSRFSLKFFRRKSAVAPVPVEASTEPASLKKEEVPSSN